MNNQINRAPPGYLFNWIRQNHARIWPKSKSPPRFMGKNALAAAGFTSFDGFAKALIQRLFETVPEERQLPVEFHVLDLNYDGAWVVWPEKCYGIFITKALLWKIQRIGWHGMEVMREGKHIPVKMNFFRELWGDLPDDDAYHIQFGILIARIAFAFIIHHELAHAGLGHEGSRFIISRPGAHDEIEPAHLASDYLDEFASASAGGKVAERSQAIETDADVHAMLYTRALINAEAELLNERNIQPESVGPYVWKNLLRNPDCRQLTIFTGVAVGLLALLPDLQSERFGDRPPTSHPPAPSRIFLMFHVVGSITRYKDRFWELRSAAMSCAISLVARFLRAEGMRVESRQKNDECVERKIESDTDERSRAAAKWGGLRHLTLVDAMFRTTEIGEYWETLVSDVRWLSSRLNGYARFPDELRYAWYRTEKQSPAEQVD